MNKPVLRCRCGHHVFGREILRVEPYEKESGRESVYVKYRCRRCKHFGEAFFDRLEFNAASFAAPRDEMSDDERDRFFDEKTISSSDVISFHRSLMKIATLEDLKRVDARGRRAEKNAEAKVRKNNEKGNGDPSQTRRPNS